MTDWVTISSLATAGGTLVLAAATFAAVRSSNQAARTTERALLAGIRPLLMPTRLQDPPEKVGFRDDHWVKVAGGGGVAEATDDAIYFAIAVRNVGSGLAVLDRWDFYPERARGDMNRHEPEEFPHRLTRDLYIAAGDQGFWQGALREPTAPGDQRDPMFDAARDAINARTAMTVDLLYGDHEGGQRTISRFTLMPRDDGSYLAIVSRHWNLDRADPR